MNKKIEHSLDSILSFGRYKGESIRDVISRNPSIVKWYTENVGWFSLDGRAGKMLNKSLERQEMIREAHPPSQYTRDNLYDFDEQYDDAF